MCSASAGAMSGKLYTPPEQILQGEKHQDSICLRRDRTHALQTIATQMMNVLILFELAGVPVTAPLPFIFGCRVGCMKVRRREAKWPSRVVMQCPFRDSSTHAICYCACKRLMKKWWSVTKGEYVLAGEGNQPASVVALTRVPRHSIRACLL